VGDTKDFRLFLKRNDCIIDGDLRMITGLVRLRISLKKRPSPFLGRTVVMISGHT